MKKTTLVGLILLSLFCAKNPEPKKINDYTYLYKSERYYKKEIRNGIYAYENSRTFKLLEIPFETKTN